MRVCIADEQGIQYANILWMIVSTIKKLYVALFFSSPQAIKKKKREQIANIKLSFSPSSIPPTFLTITCNESIKKDHLSLSPSLISSSLNQRGEWSKRKPTKNLHQVTHDPMSSTLERNSKKERKKRISRFPGVRKRESWERQRGRD